MNKDTILHHKMGERVALLSTAKWRVWWWFVLAVIILCLVWI